ncbi:DNA gyrase subunit A [Clostridium tertium]|uniref:DNA gyrase subunit A n=1 Tax=Clostridium tertium TaxID=1559 RepID=UPI0023B2127D|nr:DNA gyrase subunit A [Clostridium tertium]
MKISSLKEIVLTKYKEAARESLYDSHFPSLIDGNRPVNKAILLAMKELSRASTSPIQAQAVVSRTYEKYHLHSPTGIYRTAVLMTCARVPLIQARNRNGEAGAYDPDDGEAISQRYISLALTPIGLDFVNSTIISPMTTTFNGSTVIPEVFMSLFPNNLFQVYWDIAIGISTVNLPLCPKEVFQAMKFLLNNDLKATFEELAQFIKGFDTESYHTHITTPQNLYSLIEEGDAKTSVLTTIGVTSNTIIIKGAPVGKSFKSLAKEIDAIHDNRMKGRLNGKIFKTFLMNKIETPNNLVIVHYTPIGNATPQQVRQEVYDLTSAHKEYRVEFVGTLPREINGQSIERRLHKMSVRDIMVSCIRNGYSTRVAEINKKIDELKEDRMYNELLEKLTRPETQVWFPSIINRSDKVELFMELANNGDKTGIIRNYIGRDADTVIKDVMIGDILVKGGITLEEAKLVFQKKGDSMLARLEERSAALAELATFNLNLKNLQKQLEHEAILTYLNSILDRWMALPGMERRSPVLYKQTGDEIRDIKQNLMMQNNMLNRIKNNKVHCILYKDNTIEMKLSLQGLNLSRVKSIEEFNRESQLVVLTQDINYLIKEYKLDIPIPYEHVTEQSPFKGMYIWKNDKIYLFVTNRGRVKLINSKDLYQIYAKKVGFYLNPDEVVMPPLIFDKDTSFDNLAIEILTAFGIKRMDLQDMSISKKRGWKQMFSTRPTNVLDFRVIDKDTENAICETNQGLKFIEYDKLDVYKRNVSKEFEVVQDDLRLTNFIDHKMLYIGDKLLTPSKEVLKLTFKDNDKDVSYNAKVLESDTSIDTLDRFNKYVLEKDISDIGLKYHIKTIW